MFSHLLASFFLLDFSRQAQEIGDLFPAGFRASGFTQMSDLESGTIGTEPGTDPSVSFRDAARAPASA